MPQCAQRSFSLAVLAPLVALLCSALALILVAASARGQVGAAAQRRAESTACGVVEMKELRLSEGTALAVEVIGANDRPLAILVRAPKGFVVCANFDLKALESRGVAAASVQGLKAIDDVLQARIVGTTKQARGLGITAGMSAPDALLKLM